MRARGKTHRKVCTHERMYTHMCTNTWTCVHAQTQPAHECTHVLGHTHTQSSGFSQKGWWPLLFLFIYLFLAVLGLRCRSGFSLVAAGRSCSLVAVHRLLIAVASPVAENRLQGVRASVVVPPGLQSTGSTLGVCGLSCPKACGSFWDQGSNSCVFALAGGFLSLRYQGPPQAYFCSSSPAFSQATLLVLCKFTI